MRRLQPFQALITQEQLEALTRLAEERRVPRAVVIREALDEYLRTREEAQDDYNPTYRLLEER